MSIITADTAESLERIADANIELAMWQRRLPDELVEWLHQLPGSALPTARLSLYASEVSLALHAACDESGLPVGQLRETLVADIADLAERFANVIASDRLRLRLETVDDNACRRFHRDCVPLRLLTTYRGPGTDWVRPDFAELALAHADDYSGPTERMATYDVAIFKGCGFHGQIHDAGVVHRSPPIADTGTTRLLLCLNVPTDWGQASRRRRKIHSR